MKPIERAKAIWIDRIQAAEREVERQKAAFVEVLRSANDDGVTWTEIGEALGQSQQAVHRKFARKRL